MSPHTVAFGLGANLGDARGALADAVRALSSTPGIDVGAVSSLYRTAPVGGPEQPDYLNAVLVGATTLSPMRLLGVAQAIEADHHRTREVRWGPRTLDIDVLAVSDVTSDDPQLLLPHPRAHERGFVLLPWAEADPGFVVPGRGAVADLAAQLPAEARADVVAIAAGAWWQGAEVVS